MFSTKLAFITQLVTSLLIPGALGDQSWMEL